MRQARRLGQFLATHLRNDLKFVYFNMLIRPRAVPNLAPYQDQDFMANATRKALAGKYYGEYSTKVALRAPVTPNAMKAYDQVIKTANEEAVKAIATELAGTPIKLVPVDLYSAIERYNSKHYGDSRAVEVKKAGKLVKRITNLPFAMLSAQVPGRDRRARQHAPLGDRICRDGQRDDPGLQRGRECKHCLHRPPRHVSQG